MAGSTWRHAISGFAVVGLTATAIAAWTLTIVGANYYGSSPPGSHPTAVGSIDVEICWDLPADAPSASTLSATAIEEDPLFNDPLGPNVGTVEEIGGTYTVGGMTCRKFRFYFAVWDCESGDEELRLLAVPSG